MKRIRITGIVRTANRLRRELAGPISSDRLAQLREDTEDSVRTVNSILAEAKVSYKALPAPSRKAYQFLAGIDFDAIKTREIENGNGISAQSISFPGLRGYLDSLLDNLDGNDKASCDLGYEAICNTSEHIEQGIVSDGIGSSHLKPESRQMRGWFAYFAGRENFDAYVRATELAKPVFDTVLENLSDLREPAILHFRPMKSLFRIRPCRDATRIQLPTPMICFDECTFQALGDRMSRKNHGMRAIVDAMQSGQYQEIVTEIELLGGLVEHSSGVYHDLAESFTRINSAYFGGNMPQPRLTWNNIFTFRKFGHYDHTTDTVMVSSTVDRDNVPEFVVDFLIYHELLHKKLGVLWGNGRKLAHHNAEFTRLEQSFAQYSQSKKILTKLARK